MEERSHRTGHSTWHRLGFESDVSRIEVDLQWFPVVLQRWPDPVSDAALEVFFQAIDDAARRAQREHTFYVTVSAAQGVLEPAQRRRVAQWIRTQPRELRERAIGSYVVIKAPVQRGIVTALRWVLPEMKAVFAVDTIESAVEGALATLKARGVAAPSSHQVLRYVAATSASQVRDAR
jgi:hypothetical protein